MLKSQSKHPPVSTTLQRPFTTTSRPMTGGRRDVKICSKFKQFVTSYHIHFEQVSLMLKEKHYFFIESF